MTPAVQAAIEELEAEQARIGQMIDTLKEYAGGGNGTAPKPVRVTGGGGTAKCSECGKVCATAGGLAVHKARAHGG